MVAQPIDADVDQSGLSMTALTIEVTNGWPLDVGALGYSEPPRMYVM
jgi:hypothetical protein